MKKIFIAIIISGSIFLIASSRIANMDIIEASEQLKVDPISPITNIPNRLPPKLESCWNNEIKTFSHSSLILTEENDGYICFRCKEFVEKRYGFTDDDIYLLAQLLCGDGITDGDGEYDFDYKKEIDYSEISKVLGVVMNRQKHEKFPDTVKDIVLAKNQFYVFPRNLKVVPSEKALTNVKDWCDAYDRYDGGAQTIPEDHIYFSGNGFTNKTRS